MIKNLLLLILVTFSQGYVNATVTWTQKPDFGGGIRWGAVGFAIGDKGYIGMGASTNTFFKDFWEYNPAANTWTQKATMPAPAAGRLWGAGFAIGNKGYMGLGADLFTGWFKDFYEYDVAGNTWTRKADFPGGARDQVVCFTLGNKGYMGTGRVNNVTQKDFWEYDPAAGDSGTWTKKADFDGVARIDAAGFAIGNKGYIGTGTPDGAVSLKDFWEYDPDNDQWTQKADFGGSVRHFAVGFSTGTNGYIGMGSNHVTYPNTTFYKDFWQYDPYTDTWTSVGDFPGSDRERTVGFAVGNKAYVGTGIYDPLVGAGTDTYLKDFWEFDDGTVTASNEVTIKNESSVYPNPTNGQFVLNTNSLAAEGVFYLYDMSGRLVYSENIFGFKGERTINASMLSSGKYYWQLQSGSIINASGQLVISR